MTTSYSQAAPQTSRAARRDAGNAIAARQGAPVTQSSIDEMWAGVAAKRNGTLPGRDMKNDHGLLPSARSGSRAPQNQAEIDAMHSEIAAKLNATLPVEWRPKTRR